MTDTNQDPRVSPEGPSKNAPEEAIGHPTAASGDLLNSLHQQVAKTLTEGLKDSSGALDPKVLELAIKFLKDNNIKADMRFSKTLKGVAKRLPPGEVVEGLPFDVPDDTEED